ncbi:hypothetical protein [Oryzobacter telluris]|uniref:hypothetical protein n=1 Tax=Oryzobacter telluris TaxID=3149179 RepID=UPI00370D4C5D
MRTTRFAGALAAAALLCIIPMQPAAAGTGDGGGGADYNITTQRFTAISCHFYSSRQWPSGYVETLHVCSGGVRYSGGGYYGVACATHGTGSGWGWYAKPCSQV